MVEVKVEVAFEYLPYGHFIIYYNRYFQDAHYESDLVVYWARSESETYKITDFLEAEKHIFLFSSCCFIVSYVSLGLKLTSLFEFVTIQIPTVFRTTRRRGGLLF